MTNCPCCDGDYEIKEGDRRHWFYWGTDGTHCNKEKKREEVKHG